MFVDKHVISIEYIKNTLLFKKNANSRILRITNAKFFRVSFVFILFMFYFVLFYFISFFFSTNIKGDFQICISVPLIDFINSQQTFLNVFLDSFCQYLLFLDIIIQQFFPIFIFSQYFLSGGKVEFTAHCLYRD